MSSRRARALSRDRAGRAWGTVRTTSRLAARAAGAGGRAGRRSRARSTASASSDREAGKGGRQSSESGTREGTSEVTTRRQARAPRRWAAPRRGGGGAATPVAGEQRRWHRSGRVDDPTTRMRVAERRGRQRRRVERRSVAPSHVPAPKPSGDGIEYPEWDWEAGDYREQGAIVRDARTGRRATTRGANTVLARHGALVRRLRERFERLRARRARLNQQRDGDELDLRRASARSSTSGPGTRSTTGSTSTFGRRVADWRSRCSSTSAGRPTSGSMRGAG